MSGGATGVTGVPEWELHPIAIKVAATAVAAMAVNFKNPRIFTGFIVSLPLWMNCCRYACILLCWSRQADGWTVAMTEQGRLSLGCKKSWHRHTNLYQKDLSFAGMQTNLQVLPP
jgi:hypothetical protein